MMEEIEDINRKTFIHDLAVEIVSVMMDVDITETKQ